MLKQLEGHVGAVNVLAISIDGRTIVSGSEDKTVRVWSEETGQVLMNDVVLCKELRHQPTAKQLSCLVPSRGMV